MLSEDSPNEAWQRIRPVLDDALHQLKEADRAGVVLRFLEDRTLREVGARLGLNENAARMRVDRALEKLRGLLARRGITSSASGLAAALAIGVVTPAPAALAAAIASTALASGAAAGSTTLTLMKIMSLTNVKVSLIGALVVAGIAVPVWQQTRLQRVQSENAQLLAQVTQLTATRSEVGRLSTVGADQAELERLRQWQAQTKPELLRLRGMAGVARRANLEAEELRAQLARQTRETGTNLLSGAMADAMKQAMEQQVDGRLSRMTASLHLTPEQAQAARDILMRQAQVMSAGMQQVFSGKYNKEEATHNARLAANSDLLQMQSTLGLTSEQQDRAFAALYEVSFNQLTGSATQTFANRAEQLQWGFDQKAKALESVLTPTQLENYRQQQAIQLKLVKDILSKMEGTNSSN